MTTKYKVTDKNGVVYTRTTRNRVYTHAVIRHWNAYDYERPDYTKVINKDGRNIWPNDTVIYATQHVPAGSAAWAWVGRADLVQAQVNAAWKGSNTADVEVIAIK